MGFSTRNNRRIGTNHDHISNHGYQDIADPREGQARKDIAGDVSRRQYGLEKIVTSTWQAKNPEKWREYKNAYYQKNAEAIRAKKKEWADANRDRINAQRALRRDAERERHFANKDRLVPNELLRAARRRAKSSGIECTITLDDILVPEVCPLLDLPLKSGIGKLSANSPSLDRIDNTKGYVPGNVWVISYQAKAAKGALTADELIQIGMRLKASLAEGVRS